MNGHWIYIPVIWIVYFVINLILAEWNVYLVHQAIKKGNTTAIKHGWWALGYGILCVAPWFIYHDWRILASIALLHLSAFPVAYNSIDKFTWFHLSPTSKAITDAIMRQIGLKTTAIVNIGALALSLGLLMWQIIKPLNHG